jgi:hypothetical protein
MVALGYRGETGNCIPFDLKPLTRSLSSWAWRLPSLLQGLPSICQVLLVFFGPESPRWLISKGRDRQALKTLAYYHADGNEYVFFLHKSIRSTNEILR